MENLLTSTIFHSLNLWKTPLDGLDWSCRTATGSTMDRAEEASRERSGDKDFSKSLKFRPMLYLETSHKGACSQTGQASIVAHVGDSMHDKNIQAYQMICHRRYRVNRVLHPVGCTRNIFNESVLKTVRLKESNAEVPLFAMNLKLNTSHDGDMKGEAF